MTGKGATIVCCKLVIKLRLSQDTIREQDTHTHEDKQYNTLATHLYNIVIFIRDIFFSVYVIREVFLQHFHWQLVRAF